MVCRSLFALAGSISIGGGMPGNGVSDKWAFGMQPIHFGEGILGNSISEWISGWIGKYILGMIVGEGPVTSAGVTSYAMHIGIDHRQLWNDCERTCIISHMIRASGPWAEGRNILDYDGWAGSDIIPDGGEWAHVGNM
ncbi:hypothetical protein EDB19DRAFT_1835985 [Suillus lakei]|nr:hypothetical protein EDB19DRAFT_1835985 [Suillus lakei]